MATPHDKLAKAVLSQLEHARAELWSVLPPSIVEEADWSSFALVSGRVRGPLARASAHGPPLHGEARLANRVHLRVARAHEHGGATDAVSAVAVHDEDLVALRAELPWAAAAGVRASGPASQQHRLDRAYSFGGGRGSGEVRAFRCRDDRTSQGGWCLIGYALLLAGADADRCVWGRHPPAGAGARDDAGPTSTRHGGASAP